MSARGPVSSYARPPRKSRPARPRTSPAGLGCRAGLWLSGPGRRRVEAQPLDDGRADDDRDRPRPGVVRETDDRDGGPERDPASAVPTQDAAVPESAGRLGGALAEVDEQVRRDRDRPEVPEPAP